MKTYDLYLDSGPKMKKTMVHVPALLGCTVRGDTTQAALDATPEGVRVYLHFLARHGERVDPGAPFRTRVAEHVTDGAWPGMGAAFLPIDAEPLTERQADALMARLGGLHADLRKLTAGLKPAQLDRSPAKGRPIRRILSHVCCEGGYLREVTGASRIQREVDEGRLDANHALDRLLELEMTRLRGMTKAQRAEVIMRGQSPWTARSAIRKMLEHGWEHYVEIAERLGVAP
jgi:predicted RNase H-like HicB family nuclease